MTNLTLDRKLQNLVGIPREAQPFYFPKGERLVVFIHGFSDSLCRVNGVGERLAKKGVATKGILLPGHGRSIADLAKTNPNDWYRQVEKDLFEAVKSHKEVYVIGISFGGNLALKFDAKNPGLIKGIVTIEAPMRIKNQYLTRAAIPFAKLFGMKYWKKKFLKKIQHPEKETVFKQGVLDSMPLDNIAQIIDFLENKQGFLRKVTTDTLLIQSLKSSLVTKNSAQLFFDQISSKRKEIYRIENVYHAFLNERSKKAIFSKSLKFFDIEV